MKQSEVHVPSFEVDHTTLQPGLYLREVRRVGIFAKIKIWDLRFVAPSAHTPLSAATMHSIEHIMAYKLRAELGKKYIGFYTYGCKTGFAFVSKRSLSQKELSRAICTVITESIPVLSKDEIPCLTEKECGNPNLYELKGTTTALQRYYEVLTGLNQ